MLRPAGVACSLPLRSVSRALGVPRAPRAELGWSAKEVKEEPWRAVALGAFQGLVLPAALHQREARRRHVSHVSMAAKNRFTVYAVQKGHQPGVYRSWEECKKQVQGFSKAVFRGFTDEQEALVFAQGGLQSLQEEVRMSSEPIKPALSEAQLEKEAELLSELHEVQRALAQEVLAGQNVFITGNPGCGKSFVMKCIIKVLRMRKGADAVSVCASTGVAGIHVGGSTLHSFLGCGLGETDQDWHKAFRNKKAKSRIRRTEVLLIDEVSMLSGDFLDRASKLVADVRGKPEEPFGGLQVVLSGDFLQLPPVRASTMAFEAAAWQALKLRHFNLQHNFRQSGDGEFQELLSGLRLGVLDLPRLQSLCVAEEETNGEVHPKIVSTNAEALKINSKNLASLPGLLRSYAALDTADKPKEQGVKQAFQNLQAEEVLELKLGCVVMLLKNLRLPSRCKPVMASPDGGQKKLVSLVRPNHFVELPAEFKGLQTPLVNGSLGVVVGFEEPEEGEHEMDLELLPVVDFGHGYRALVKPADFEGELGHLGSYCRRQVPLKLAWAVTVHKTQGLTLQTGELDLSRAFDPAQLYVALSRFKSLSGVKISGLPKRLPRNSELRERALAFHQALPPSAVEQSS